MYICIDAGHGGADPGAIGGGACEKWVTAEVALRAGELLHAAGCLVFLTRVGDRRVSLGQRLYAAQETEAELFVSLHCGLASGPEPRGLTVFYPRADACSQTWAETVLRASEARISGRTVARGAQPIGWRHPCGSSTLLKAVGSQMPACLVELGCLSNPQDARLLQERLFLDDLARGLTTAVLAWRQRLERALDMRLGMNTKTQRTQSDREGPK